MPAPIESTFVRRFSQSKARDQHRTLSHRIYDGLVGGSHARDDGGGSWPAAVPRRRPEDRGETFRQRIGCSLAIRSDGTLMRPGLQNFLADINAGQARLQPCSHDGSPGADVRGLREARGFAAPVRCEGDRVDGRTIESHLDSVTRDWLTVRAPTTLSSS